MKIKSLLLAMTLLPFVCQAQNALTVAETTIPQSGGWLTFNFTFAEENVYSTYQFKIETPEGVTYVTDADSDVDCILGDCHTSSHQAVVHWNSTTRVLGVGVTSMSSSLLKGTSGMLISIPVAATEATVGSTFDLKVMDITFIRQNGTKDQLADATITVTVGEPDDGRIKFDENSTKLPTYTVGEKGNITMKRTIKANEWSTLVLPFNLTNANAKTVFGDNVQFAKFTGFQVDYGDDESNITPLGITINLTSYTIPARGNMAGGTPVLIKTEKDITEIKLDNVTLTEGVTDATANDEYGTSGKFTGTLVKSVIPLDGLFISGNDFWYSTGNTNVKAFRCWFELGAVLNKDTDFGARVYLNFDDSEATGITISRETISDNHYYDLQGRRIVEPGKGIYVKEGKKVIVK